MPIYAYACGACGFKKDVLQKLSDAPLTDCPSCGQAQFSKQLTAPGFVLKGSGWYVTDFREGQKKPSGGSGAADATGSGSDTKPASESSASATPAETAPSTTPASTPAPSSASSGSSGSTSAASTPAKAA